MHTTRSTSSISSNSTHLLPQKTQSNKKSLNATQARIKLFGLFTAFSSFLSENKTQIYEKLKSKVIKPVFVPSDHASEASRLFIDAQMMTIRDVWMGDKDEKQVAKRLRALSKEDVLQDRGFAEWSIYALTEVPGTHPKSQYKLKWLKEGEVHTSTVDVISKAPGVVTTNKGKVESLSSGVHAALIHKLGGKAIELSTMEECIKAFNEERYGTQNEREPENEEELEATFETHCAVPDRSKPKKDKEKPDVESKDTDEKEAVNDDNDDTLNLFDNEIEDHVYDVSPDDVSDDSDDEEVVEKVESDSESNEVEDDEQSESEKKKRDFIFTRSYMTLRPTEKDRLEGKTRGKRVYFNPYPRYYNPKLKRDAPMKRYFPPAFKLPKNCR